MLLSQASFNYQSDRLPTNLSTSVLNSTLGCLGEPQPHIIRHTHEHLWRLKRYFQ